MVFNLRLKLFKNQTNEIYQNNYQKNYKTKKKMTNKLLWSINMVKQLLYDPRRYKTIEHCVIIECFIGKAEYRSSHANYICMF